MSATQYFSDPMPCSSSYLLTPISTAQRRGRSCALCSLTTPARPRSSAMRMELHIMARPRHTGADRMCWSLMILLLHILRPSFAMCHVACVPL